MANPTGINQYTKGRGSAKKKQSASVDVRVAKRKSKWSPLTQRQQALGSVGSSYNKRK